MKTLVISVGGSPEGQAKTIRELQPEKVVFLVSQASVDNIPQIKHLCSGTPFQDWKAMVDDETDLSSCYEKAREALRLAIDLASSGQDVGFDFTGGTKVMSAALVLAGGEVGAQPFYVGGKERNKGGLGVVVSGTEEVTTQANPWDAFAVPQQRRAALLFNQGRIDAARDTMAGVCGGPCSARLREWADIAVGLMDFYVHWDAFRHGEAIAAVRKSRARERLRAFSAAVGEGRIGELRDAVEKGVQYVQDLLASSDGGRRPILPYVCDVLANAKRRASEGRWDDAVARLYRALEMLAQVRLAGAYRIDAEKVDEAMLPRQRRQAVDERLGPPPWEGLGLWRAFQLLDALGDRLGKRFLADQEMVRGMLQVRNHSMLAHGLKPVQPEVFERFLEKVMHLGDIHGKDLPVFPVWPEEVN